MGLGCSDSLAIPLVPLVQCQILTKNPFLDVIRLTRFIRKVSRNYMFHAIMSHTVNWDSCQFVLDFLAACRVGVIIPVNGSCSCRVNV